MKTSWYSSRIKSVESYEQALPVSAHSKSRGSFDLMLGSCVRKRTNMAAERHYYEDALLNRRLFRFFGTDAKRLWLEQNSGRACIL